MNVETNIEFEVKKIKGRVEKSLQRNTEESSDFYNDTSDSHKYNLLNLFILSVIQGGQNEIVTLLTPALNLTDSRLNVIDFYDTPLPSTLIQALW